MRDTINVLFIIAGSIAGLFLVTCIAMLYFKNLFKVIHTLQGKNKVSVRTPIRIFGVFFPLLGIAMGLVKGE